jgi:Holliday junction resolvasome RuvABC endonuclease subunit
LILSLDPGNRGTGWALWDEKHWKHLVPPVNAGLIQTHKHFKHWMQRAYYLGDEFEKLFLKYDIKEVISEYPQYFHRSSKGQASVESGDIFKLVMLTGIYSQIAYTYSASFILVFPQEWKGQLPKQVVEARINRLLGKKIERYTVPGLHIHDAIGIGLWKKGFLNANSKT